MTRLDEIEARLAAATPGKWQYFIECVAGGNMVKVSGATDEDDYLEICWVDGPDDDGRLTSDDARANACLIAHAPTDLRDLVAVAKAATNMLAEGGVRAVWPTLSELQDALAKLEREE